MENQEMFMEKYFVKSVGTLFMIKGTPRFSARKLNSISTEGFLSVVYMVKPIWIDSSINSESYGLWNRKACHFPTHLDAVVVLTIKCFSTTF